MFTGIIETLGSIEEITTSGTNKSFWISSVISNELKPDQSLSHNGVCLTVEEVIDGKHRVTAISETLGKTTLGDWKRGNLVNLERCLAMKDRLDGHFVQGHVDTTACCVSKTELDGSWEFSFEFPPQFAGLIIEKGSISLNGISLTVFNVTKQNFSVAIIPYTYEHTNMRQIAAGSLVNLEFDMIGKYISRMHQLSSGN
jgi:riboflavin synthase